MSNSTFPYDAKSEQAYKSNPAIRLFGNRFSTDQTSLELLGEFLLITTSVKEIEGKELRSALPPLDDIHSWSNSKLKYSPKIKLNLKLFAFLCSSRLDSRHLTHREHYTQLIQELKKRIKVDSNDKTQVVKTLENLLLGFQGAGTSRTWCAQSFIPISRGLVAGEAIWNETKAKSHYAESWSYVLDNAKLYFSLNKHRFLARGGELLYLQICQAMKQNPGAIQAWNLDAKLEFSSEELEPEKLLNSLERGLAKFFSACPKFIDDLAEFIDDKLDPETAAKTDMHEQQPRFVEAGWCNSATWQEGYLLAVEMNRILSSGLDVMDSVYYLETLFMLHTLRNLIMQSSRCLSNGEAKWPGYYMAINRSDEENGTLKRISHQSLKNIEKTIYMAIRSHMQGTDIVQDEKILKEADTRSGHKFFLKMAKQAGLVIPKRGAWARFVLTPQILRVLVTTIVPQQGRITYETFKQLIRARWGMVFDEDGFGECCEWLGVEKVYLSSDTDAWLLEMLAESGLLMHLSDSCALVLHPNQGNDGAGS
ncbi:MAG TPA: hypothetical protein PL124_04130 [Candidatus Cloacimonadota bacterium]|nr:hypothetical protein [Candidatus Cloacimonadota bacterium]